jgi:hypothetical protein
MMRCCLRAVVFAALMLIAACGDTPMQPTPQPGVNQPPPPPPVNNTAPTIDSITVQGTRRNEPPNFADVSETVDVTAVVRDQETPVEQLQYVWTATAGTISGTGAKVSWQAPAAIQAPIAVTVTLEIVERYGTNQVNRATRSAPLSLHDSAKEVGDMSRKFLLDFSDTNIKDAAIIMQNFGNAATCPQPNEVTDERGQVTNHYQNYRMIEYRVGEPVTTVNFGGSCPFRSKRGDACALVPVYWHSVHVPTNRTERVQGTDVIAASYSPADNRWWLCASDFDGVSLLKSTTQSFYIR